MRLLHTILPKKCPRWIRRNWLRCNLIQKTFPKEWKYVGDGKVIIDCLNPDFINCNGKKLVIELFGDYWHSNEIAHITEEERKKRFMKYGFDMLVIWESELTNLTDVLGKIKNFMEGK